MNALSAWRAIRAAAPFVGCVVGVLALYALLLRGVCQPVENDYITDRLIADARLAVAALSAVPPESREPLALALSSSEMIVSRLRPPDMPPDDAGAARAPDASTASTASSAEHDAARARLFEWRQALRAALPGDVTLVETRGCPEPVCLLVGARVGDATWWLGFWFPQRATHWALASTIAVAGLAWAVAVLAARASRRRAMKPMLRLVQDLATRRSAPQPIDWPVRDGLEIEPVIRSVNDWIAALRRTEQSRRQLLAGVSHDIRTALARLRLRAEIECGDEAYQAMEDDFKAVTRVIDQFLIYSQGQSDLDARGRQQPLAELITQGARLYRETAGVQVTRLDACAVKASALLVQRALSNLIDNALAHGRSPVEIELRAVDGGAELWVFDRGQGIAPADQARALEPFVKLGRGAQPGGHCGLGLAILAQIAQALDGRVVMQPFDGRRFGMGLFVPGLPERTKADLAGDRPLPLNQGPP